MNLHWSVSPKLFTIWRCSLYRVLTIWRDDCILIHEADPQSQITIFPRGVCTRPSICTSQNLRKQNNIQVRIVIAPHGTVGLAEWLIIHLFSFFSRHESFSKSLWDESEIDISLRSVLSTAGFGTSNSNINNNNTASASNSVDVIKCIEDNDAEAIKNVIANLNPSKMDSLLLFATWKSASRVVEILLTKGANVNAADTAGRTCLHLAAINGKLDIVRQLLKYNARVDVFDHNHLATPLFCSAVADNTNGLKLLLEHGSNINAGLQEYGVSALHCAVRANNIENVRHLLEMGAEPNSVQLFSETPLHTAASMGYEECVRLLIDHGASLEVAMGTMKMTALHLAAQDGNTESVQYLAQGGANVDVKNDRGQSALHLAALAQSPETVEVLLNSGSFDSFWFDCDMCHPGPGTK